MTAISKNVILPLMQKDIRLQKRTTLFLLFFVFILLMSVSGEGFGSPYITAAVGASVFWTMSVCSYEGFYKTERLFASLPVSRRELVISRYLSSLLAILAAIAVSGIVGWLVSMLHIRPETAVISLADGAAAFLISSCLLFGYLPVYFKLGYLRSRMLNIAVFAALGLVLAGFSLLLDAVGISISEVSAAAAAAVLVFWAVLGFVSVRLAIRFFRRREL